MMIRSMHIDGGIFVAIAVFGSVATGLGTDNAAKWIDPKTLWFAQQGCASAAAGLLALKMFRSTSYSKDQDERKANGNGAANGH